jgi:hypothetical protein
VRGRVESLTSGLDPLGREPRGNAGALQARFHFVGNPRDLVAGKRAAVATPSRPLVSRVHVSEK